MTCEPEECIGFDHPAGSPTRPRNAFAKLAMFLPGRIGHALGNFKGMGGHEGRRAGGMKRSRDSAPWCRQRLAMPRCFSCGSEVAVRGLGGQMSQPPED